jgi:hypothetical protein
VKSFTAVKAAATPSAECGDGVAIFRERIPIIHEYLLLLRKDVPLIYSALLTYRRDSNIRLRNSRRYLRNLAIAAITTFSP